MNNFLRKGRGVTSSLQFQTTPQDIVLTASITPLKPKQD